MLRHSNHGNLGLKGRRLNMHHKSCDQAALQSLLLHVVRLKKSTAGMCHVGLVMRVQPPDFVD